MSSPYQQHWMKPLNDWLKSPTTTIDADRGTIFLNDERTGELYSRVAQGNFRREIEC